MYRQNAGDSGEQMTFRRGEYNIPANYRGNAFTADEIPTAVSNNEVTAETQMTECEAAKEQAEGCDLPCETENKRPHSPSLLYGIGSDDILIVGLILLLMQRDRDDSSDRSDIMPILLLLLLLGGF